MRRALGALAVEHLSANRPAKVISGMALGWDQAVAAACVALGIPFVAAVPFRGQENTWPAQARERYDRLLDAADEVTIVSSTEAADPMQVRNCWMVDRADAVLALWDGSWGGTFNCVTYARKVGRPITNLWVRWSMPEDVWDLLG